MLNLNIIASGSSGNSYCLETDKSYIFVDIGVTRKKLESVMEIDLLNKDICLFITHEHHDHIAGYKPFINKYKPQVYCTEGTAAVMDKNGLDIQNSYILDPGKIYDINGFDVAPFDIHHDSCQPVGYRFDIAGNIVTFATDLGIVDDLVLDHLVGSDLLILESNYEEEILKKGKYPLYLKNRIMSAKGHLSNMEALNTLGKIADSGIGKVFLSHVSEENNDYTALDKYAAFAKEHYDIDTKVIKQGESFRDIKVSSRHSVNNCSLIS